MQRGPEFMVSQEFQNRPETIWKYLWFDGDSICVFHEKTAAKNLFFPLPSSIFIAFDINTVKYLLSHKGFWIC